MTEALRPTRDRLIEAAAVLFQKQGYHGTAVADVLTLARVPKGSLYHHFPNGKSDLATAAATMTSELMLDIVARAYAPATSFAEGTLRMCEKFARLFERHPHWRACPVQTLLLDGPIGHGEAQRLLDIWIDATATEAARLNCAVPEMEARRVWSVLIGCWTFARAADDATPLREMPALLGDASTRIT